MKIYMDFAGMLAIATAVTGFVWLVDILFFKKKRLAKDPNAPEPKLVEYAHSFFPILLIVFILRAFIAEPYRIPSGSMKPTLLEGDFILVNKYDYGFRLPLTGTLLKRGNAPKRGDILIFRYPENTSMNFVKRIIGLPGDKISYKDKKVFINGEPVSQEFLGASSDVELNGQSFPVKKFDEKLPGRDHDIFLYAVPGEDMAEITVPEGKYFVLGDNRDKSGDSRFWGFVPEELILGKAVMIWMSWDSVSNDVRYKRIGQVLKR